MTSKTAGKEYSVLQFINVTTVLLGFHHQPLTIKLLTFKNPYNTKRM